VLLDVGGVGVGQYRLARDQDRQQEQHGQKCVATEDVAKASLSSPSRTEVRPVLSSGSEVAAARTVAPNSTPDSPTWSAAAVPPPVPPLPASLVRRHGTAAISPVTAGFKTGADEET